MRPTVSSELRAQVSNLVGLAALWAYPRERRVYAETEEDLIRAPAFDILQPYADIMPDCVFFHSQMVFLEDYKLPLRVAHFKDSDSSATIFPILLRIPSLQSVEQSYDRLSNTIANSGLSVTDIDSKIARKVFEDRLGEFLAVRNSPSAVTGATTIVHSNRQGDTILHAKGYFVSTGVAFGVSTPAVASLSAGRYSFGIMDGGNPRFEGIVWSCPATVQLNLP